MSAQVSVGLVHWPVLDGAKNIVATNVTHFDIHDIARASRTYGVENYFVINRLQEQLMYVSRIYDHWCVGKGSKYNPMRQTALGIVKPIETVEAAIASFDKKPIVIATAARNLPHAKSVTFSDLRSEFEGGGELDRPYLILFGTGYGLHGQVLELCDYLLEPIRGASKDDYRHLSVRSAVSICLDRLLGL